MLDKLKFRKENTIIVDGAGDKTAIQDRVHKLKTQLEESLSEYEQRKFKRIDLLKLLVALQ